MSIISMALNQNIDYIYSVSKDGYGDVTRTKVYSDVKCRWEERTTRVVGRDNELKVSTANAWILPNYIVNYDYEVYYGGRIYKVIAIEKEIALDGSTDHIRLYLI